MNWSCQNLSSLSELSIRYLSHIYSSLRRQTQISEDGISRKLLLQCQYNFTFLDLNENHVHGLYARHWCFHVLSSVWICKSLDHPLSAVRFLSSVLWCLLFRVTDSDVSRFSQFSSRLVHSCRSLLCVLVLYHLKEGQSGFLVPLETQQEDLSCIPNDSQACIESFLHFRAFVWKRNLLHASRVQAIQKPFSSLLFCVCWSRSSWKQQKQTFWGKICQQRRLWRVTEAQWTLESLKSKQIPLHCLFHSGTKNNLHVVQTATNTADIFRAKSPGRNLLFSVVFGAVEYQSWYFWFHTFVLDCCKNNSRAFITRAPLQSILNGR